MRRVSESYSYFLNYLFDNLLDKTYNTFFMTDLISPNKMKALSPQEQAVLGRNLPYDKRTWRTPQTVMEYPFRAGMISDIRSSLFAEGYIRIDDLVPMFCNGGEYFLRLGEVDSQTKQVSDPTIWEEITDAESDGVTKQLREDVTIRFYSFYESLNVPLHPQEGGWIAKGVKELRERQRIEGSVRRMDRR